MPYVAKTATHALSRKDAQGLAKILADAYEFLQIDETLAGFLIRDAIAYVAFIDPDATVIASLMNWYELVTEYDYNDPCNYSMTDPYLLIHGQLALDLDYLEMGS